MSHFEGESKLNMNVIPSAKDMSVRSVWRPHLDNILLTWTAACGRSSKESTNSWNVQENVSSEFALKNSCVDAWFVSLLTSKETNSCEFHFNEETEYSPRIHRHYTRVMNWFACVNYISLQKQEVSETTGVSLLFSLYQSSCFHSSYIPRPPCLCLIFLFGLCVSLSCLALDAVCKIHKQDWNVKPSQFMSQKPSDQMVV